MQRIVNAFSAALDAFATARSLPVVWPNRAFVPPLGPHLRAVLRADQPIVASLGPDAYIRHSGALVVDVATLAGEGESDALVIAGELIKAFRRGQSLGLDGLNTKMGGAAPGEVHNGLYTVSVTLPYYAYLQEN